MSGLPDPVRAEGAEASPSSRGAHRRQDRLPGDPAVDEDGIAGLYGVATRTDASELGLARILCSMAFDEAGVLHSTPMACSLYENLGFRRVADFRLCSTPDILHL